MRTRLLHNIFYSLLIITAAIVLGCEEEEKDSNQKPLLKFVSPDDGAEFYLGDSILVKVISINLDCEILDVSIFDNNELLVSFSEPPFEYNWYPTLDDVAEHTLKAIATDYQQEETTEEIIFTINGYLPEIYFNTEHQHALVGESIQFTDSTAFKPNSWLWDFGDGNTSKEQNPSHVYTSGGTYSVSLTATNEYGSKTKTKTDYITIVDTTVTDYDNNTYKVVKIGDQYWMAENLKTTTYNNGTSIDLVTDSTAWANSSTGAYCWYDNDEATYGDTYGALYNWYAVGTGNLCPDGWHVPTDNEWKTLELYLGMSPSEVDDRWSRGTNEGSKLAGNAELWADGNLKNNSEFGSSGFSALPGGYRGFTSIFYDIGLEGCWWSAKTYAYNRSYAWFRSVYFYESKVYRFGFHKELGFSVRCVRD